MTEDTIEQEVESSSMLNALNSAFPAIDSESELTREAPFTLTETETVEPTPVVEATAVTPSESLIEEAESFFNDTTPVEDKVGEFNSESFDAETEKLSQGMDVKQGEKWKQLRNDLKAYKQKEAVTQVPPDVAEKLTKFELAAAEAEGLRLQVEELSNISAKVKVEQSLKYKNEVLNPAMEIMAAAEKIAESSGVDAELIQAIIKEGDRKRQIEYIKTHLPNLDDLEKQDMYQMIYKYNDINKVREGMLAEAATSLAKLEAEQIQLAEKAEKEEKEAVNLIQSSIWDKYKTSIPGFVDEAGAATEKWNTLRSRSLAIDFNKASGKDKAYAAFAGVALPHVLAQLEGVKKVLAKYTKNEYVETERIPRIGLPPEPVDNDDNLSFVERMNKALAKR
jgi:hypothetical protein